MKQFTLTVFSVFIICLESFAGSCFNGGDSLSEIAYKVRYLNRFLEPTDSSKAYYSGYEMYIDGKKRSMIFCKSKWKRKGSVVPAGSLSVKGSPVLLNGEFSFFSGNQNLIRKEIYENGHHKSVIDYVKYRDTVPSVFASIDYSKRYKDQPGTFFKQINNYDDTRQDYWYRNGKDGWKMYIDSSTSQFSSYFETVKIHLKKNGSDKRRAIDPLSIYVTRQINGSETESLIYGDVLLQSDSSLKIKVSNENFELYYTKYQSFTVNIDYYDTLSSVTLAPFSIQLPAEREIRLNDIQNFRVEKNIHGIGNTIGGIGLFISVVVAPLVSFNYLHGTFNKDRYLNIEKYSLSACIIGYSTAFSFGLRNYRIDNSGTKKGTWSITLNK